MLHAICARVPHVLDTVPPDLPGHGSRRQVRRRLHDTLPCHYDLALDVAVHKSGGHFLGLGLSAAPSTKHSHRALSTKRVRVIVICAMLTTLLTPTRRIPSQPQSTPLPPSTSTNAQALHVTGHVPPEAHTAQWGHECGRLALNSPRAGCEPNLAGNL